MGGRDPSKLSLYFGVRAKRALQQDYCAARLNNQKRGRRQAFLAGSSTRRNGECCQTFQLANIFSLWRFLWQTTIEPNLPSTR